MIAQRGLGRGEIPVGPLREAFLRLEPATTYDRWGQSRICKDAGCLVAERLGWYDHGSPDGPRVRRVLGLRPYQVGGNSKDRHRMRLREHVDYATALRLCEAMNLDPVDCGL